MPVIPVAMEITGHWVAVAPNDAKRKTTVHADRRAGRIAVVTARPEELERVTVALEKIVPHPVRRIRTGAVALKHGTAQQVAAELEKRLAAARAKEGAEAAKEAKPKIIPQKPGTGILIQAPPHRYEQIMKMIKEIDRAPLEDSSAKRDS